MSGIGLAAPDAKGGIGLTVPPPQTGPLSAITPQASPLTPADIAAIAEQYPRLKPLLDQTVIQWGNGPPEYQSEFYHPWETENPNKDRATLELYNRKLMPSEVKELVPAEMLHLMGAVDPRSGAAVDVGWQALKQKFLATRTPEQMKADMQDYQETKDPRAFKDYMQESRGDAYLRAALFPKINPEWNDYLSPQQRELANELQGYLRGGK
jgi:hypothetical protein